MTHSNQSSTRENPSEHRNGLGDFLYFHTIETRWNDNDVYGHVNNVVYYSYFDTVANHFLITQAGLDIHTAEGVGFVVASSCEYHSPIEYPDTVKVGLRVNKLGSKSVEYGLGIFRNDETTASAIGRFTHVFVNRESGKSVPIPQSIRDSLTSLVRKEN